MVQGGLNDETALTLQGLLDQTVGSLIICFKNYDVLENSFLTFT